MENVFGKIQSFNNMEKVSRQLKWQRKNKELGLCRQCGEKTIENKVFCLQCREKHNIRYRNLYRSKVGIPLGAKLHTRVST